MLLKSAQLEECHYSVDQLQSYSQLEIFDEMCALKSLSISSECQVMSQVEKC